jgi:UDP-N-acetylmuramate dehydrogenase
MMTIQKNISLRPYNTFGIDVTAAQFATIDTMEQLQQVILYANAHKLPLHIIGGGSNILLTKPIEGILVKNALKGISTVEEQHDTLTVKVAAGENWHAFVLHCITNNWCGVENLSLIPGCVGAAPMQNIGAYGVEVKDLITAVEAVALHNGQVTTFNNEQCKFGYRESIFKHEAKGKYIITAVTFKLSKTPNYKTSYGAIQTELDKMGVTNLSISAISQAVINIRTSKLPNPAEIGNAGSFFKNPSISVEKYQELKQTFPKIVGYTNADGTIKLAAGWLIEECGLKGVRVGNTGCHTQQALVLVNYGNATGKEIFAYSQHVINEVYQKFNVGLEREVNIW